MRGALTNETLGHEADFPHLEPEVDDIDGSNGTQECESGDAGYTQGLGKTGLRFVFTCRHSPVNTKMKEGRVSKEGKVVWRKGGVALGMGAEEASYLDGGDDRVVCKETMGWLKDKRVHEWLRG